LKPGDVSIGHHGVELIRFQKGGKVIQKKRDPATNELIRQCLRIVLWRNNGMLKSEETEAAL